MKRVAAHIALLLLCLSGPCAQAETAVETNGQQTDRLTSSTAPDIWTELKDLRDMVHGLGSTVLEQKVELRYMEARLKESESLFDEQQFELRITKSKVEQLEKDKAALEARLTTSEKEMALNLDVQKKRVEDLEIKIAGQTNNHEKEMAEQQNEVMALGVELNDTVMDVDAQKKQVEDLERRIAETLKVAFSAGYWTAGYLGPFNTETTLIYSTVHVNTGSAYNNNTGIFTAPVRGVYYFTFTAYDARPKNTGVSLYLNDKRLMNNVESNNDGGHTSVSNAILLEMSQGDVVYLRLPTGWGLYSDADNESTFSGFLLFPL